MHCIPNPRMHGLNGYFEVIQTIQWGLKNLGHDVTYAVNTVEPKRINIIFGAQVLPINILEKLAPDTIIYNFEQLKSLKKESIRPEIIYFANKFRIWDYSIANLEVWEKLNVQKINIVPVSYAPILTKIKNKKIQDIDILIYGMPGPKRLEVFSFVSRMGLKTIFASGMYGSARDELIARSKIILNVNLYDKSRIFEVVRVSYLLANKKAVVSLSESDTFIENGYEKVVQFITPNEFEKKILTLINNDQMRTEIENNGYEFISSKDIRVVLKEQLKELNH